MSGRRSLGGVVPVVDTVAQAEVEDPDGFDKIRRQSLATGANERIQMGARAPQQVADIMDSQLIKGLTTAQAAEKMAEFGPNLLAKTKAKPFLRILVEQVNILNMLVLAAAFLCFIQGVIYIDGEVLDDPDVPSGLILLFIVVACMGIGAYMEWSCYRVMADVSAMSAPTCKVVRDGSEMVLPAEEVVPGDLIILTMGDVIPADARVVQVTDMLTNEMPLTGEPHDITKTLVPEDPSSPFPSNYLYATTNVVNGSGKGVVVKTGMQTEMGKIAQHLQGEEAGLTSVQKTLNKIGAIVTYAMVVLVTLIFLISYFGRVDDPAERCGDKRNWVCFLNKSIKRSLFYAVGAIPETLQPAGMVLLVMGCKQMQAVNAATRKLAAVDTLGSCSFVCSDKTGTLTEGKMTAMSLFPRVRDSKTMALSFYPTRGFDPTGGVYNETLLTREAKLQLDQKYAGDVVAGALESLGGAESTSSDSQLVHACGVAMCINSYGTKLKQESPGVFTIDGNMSEGALVVAARKAGVQDEACHDLYKRENDMEVPFSSSRKMMATVHKLPDSGNFETIQLGKETTHMAIIKGAPDVLLPSIRGLLVPESGSKFSVDRKGFTSNDSEWYEERNRMLSDQALRVLVVTLRPLKLEESQKLLPLSSDQRLDLLLSESTTFFMMLGLMDPPRESAKHAVTKCNLAGIRVAMITGDQRPTAIAIARNLGIIPNRDEGINLEEIAQECAVLKGLNDKQDTLDKLCASVVVWARAQPSDKVTIVESLQRQGHVVAMTGDGVNDAGALKKADIGVAMGIAGTDVAKGAADIVLLDDKFATIIDAVAEGRRIFENIQKMVSYLLCVNIFEVVILFLAMLFGWPVPLEDKQLFYANLVTHEFYPWCIVWEAASQYSMATPPRDRKKPLLSRFHRTLLMPFVLVSYGGLLLTTQIIGSYMYVGAVSMEYMLGTDSLQEWAKGHHMCLHARSKFKVKHPKEGESEYEWAKDHGPMICRLGATWEYGQACKEDEDDIRTSKFNYLSGNYGKMFSFENSFLSKSSLTPKNVHAEFLGGDWNDGRAGTAEEPHWLVRCNEDGDVYKKGDKADAFDNLCWAECEKTDGSGKTPCWNFKTECPVKESEQTDDDEENNPPEMPTLYSDTNVVAWSIRKMRTMFLLTMVLMEFTMLYGFSKYEYSVPLVLTNKLFPYAWPFMFIGLHLLALLPFPDQGFAPLGVFGWILSCVIAALFYASFEGVKVIHRQWFEKEQVNKEVVAKLHAEGRLDAYTGTKRAFEKFPARQPLIEVELTSRGKTEEA